MNNLPAISHYSLKSRAPRTREEALADEIWRASNGRIRFMTIMSYIRRKGEQSVRQTYSEVTKERQVRDWVAYFSACMKNTKVELKDVP